MSTSAADYLVDRRRLRRQLGFWRVAAFVAAALVDSRARRALVRRARPRGRAYRPPDDLRLHLRQRADAEADPRGARLRRPRRRWFASTAPAAPPRAPKCSTTKSAASPRRSRWWRWSGRWPPPAPISPRSAPTAFSCAAIRSSARSACWSNIPTFLGLMDKVGVKLESIKSSPLKAAPNGLEPTSEEARAAMAALVADSFDWFKGLVKERRGLERRRTGQGRRRAGVHRPPGPAAEARRRDRRRTRGDRLAGEAKRASPRTCRCATASRIPAGADSS